MKKAVGCDLKMQQKWLFQSVVQFFSLFTMVFMVILVIKYTRFPDLDAPEEPCDRPCHELEWPRICRFKFILESHNLPYRNCDNGLHCFANKHGFGSMSNLLTVNREIPGPAIHVCIHDIVVVDVMNRIPERSISIHWRGQSLHKNPLMDGVSMVSQCPITSYTTFQYKFRASDPGTHLWQIHNGEQNMNDANYIQGIFVVRQSVRQEPHRSLIDHDESSHRIILRGFQELHETTILVNGKHLQSKDDLIFEVYKGKRYRFRTVHSGGNVKCAITVSVEKHTLLIISLDGNPVEPVNTTQFTLIAGERVDFILNTNQPIKEYELRFAFVNDCEQKQNSSAKIRYSEEKKNMKKSNIVHYSEFRLMPPVSTRFEDNCGKSATCLEDMNLLSNNLPNTLGDHVDDIFHLVYGYKSVKFGTLPGIFSIAQINNITFIYPSSPLASQAVDVPPETLCNENKKPERCQDNDICDCTYVIDIKFDSVVELVLIHNETNPTREHKFHLHGHSFYVLERRNAAEKMEKENQLKWHSKKPVRKDTLSIPRNGSAVIRFRADNIGYWLLQEEGEGSQGMQVIFHVMGEQYDVPNSFPRCGNWIGPKYFLA